MAKWKYRITYSGKDGRRRYEEATINDAVNLEMAEKILYGHLVGLEDPKIEYLKEE